MKRTTCKETYTNNVRTKSALGALTRFDKSSSRGWPPGRVIDVRYVPHFRIVAQ